MFLCRLVDDSDFSLIVAMGFFQDLVIVFENKYFSSTIAYSFWRYFVHDVGVTCFKCYRDNVSFPSCGRHIDILVVFAMFLSSTCGGA